LIETSQYSVDVDRVRRHYDRLSFLYRIFWGEHLHHGYWKADDTAQQAQIQLMEQLAQRAGIQRRSRVLDIGCGLGGSAMWLAQTLECTVAGMTISRVQAAMAAKRARSRGLDGKVRFEVQDANQWQPEPDSVDVVWIMESSEHFPEKSRFFKRCATALKPGGTLAVCAWLRRDGPTRAGEKQLVDTVAEAMMSASLDSLGSYVGWMRDAGLTVTVADDITRYVEPTWVHCERLGRNPLVRFFVRFMDGPTQRFVNAFPLMRNAYSTGAMAFGLFAAKKPLVPARVPLTIVPEI
jgi:tocopherol O-methyltransferase